MAQLDYKGWPSDKQEDRKPFDRQMPFHRIRVPARQIILPGGTGREKVISGDAYSVGARSTKDYDAKFGEDLGKDLADAIENIIPPLKLLGAISKATSSALAALIRLIPGEGSKKLADVIDDFDPLVALLKFIGSNVDALLIDSFVRSVPAWVPTFDEKLHPDIQFLEIDGILVRSHQRVDAVPFWQWHRWYDWHFAVCPSPLFSELVGFGNLHRDDDNDLGAPEGSNLVNYHKEGLPVGATVSAAAIADCEWDIGAIGLRSGPKRQGLDNEDRFPLFFNEPSTQKPHDWCWPMAGMFFWAIGRSVYDCSHATANAGRRVKRADRKPQGSGFSTSERIERGVHLNQLRPLKALATARWEAFKFRENPKHVPAIQFMFYANTHLSSAGFFNRPGPGNPESLTHRSGFTPIADQDYEFIVDLPPPLLTRKDAYPIGHTPEFALNTLVLQPRLLIDVNFAPYMEDTTGNLSGGVMEDADDREKNERRAAAAPKPIVELMGLRPGEAPRQARVRIPLKGSLAEDTNSYGMLLSMGWFDPDALQARKVKKVTVKLLSVQPAGDRHESGDAEWNLNVGVNGRWLVFRFVVDSPDRIHLGTASGKNQAAAGAPPEVVMFLAESDLVMVSAHGMEEDALDDLLRKPPEFASGQTRPSKDAPVMPPVSEIVTDPKEIGRFKTRLFERFGVLKDRLLRDAADVKLPTGTPDPKTGETPTTTVTVPMVGRELGWDADIDTDDDHRASLTARAMFMRLAIGNHFDANDPLGMIDPNLPDPAHKNPPIARSQDATDTPNPLVVRDILQQVGPGGTKNCQLSAYASEVVGRMGAFAYDPEKLDYTLFFQVKVEDLP